MTTPPNQSPNAITAAGAAKQLELELAGALARTPGEWFDVYDSIIVNAVKTTMEQHGEGGLAAERLRERDHQAKKVRATFESHGLPLSEEIEIEGGPHIVYDQNGLPQVVGWPNGEWIKFHWPDHSMIEFRGLKALIAFAFIQWWTPFHLQYVSLTDPTKLQKRRIINPGEAEHTSYMKAKRADQQKGIEP